MMPPGVLADDRHEDDDIGRNCADEPEIDAGGQPLLRMPQQAHADRKEGRGHQDAGGDLQGRNVEEADRAGDADRQQRRAPDGSDARAVESDGGHRETDDGQ